MHDFKHAGYVIFNKGHLDYLATQRTDSGVLVVAYSPTPSNALLFKCVPSARSVCEKLENPSLAIRECFENASQFGVGQIDL